MKRKFNCAFEDFASLMGEDLGSLLFKRTNVCVGLSSKISTRECRYFAVNISLSLLTTMNRVSGSGS